jgi:hypothetical protein
MPLILAHDHQYATRHDHFSENGLQKEETCISNLSSRFSGADRRECSTVPVGFPKTNRKKTIEAVRNVPFLVDVRMAGLTC